MILQAMSHAVDTRQTIPVGNVGEEAMAIVEP